MSRWPVVPIRQVLTPHQARQVIPDPASLIRFAGVRWYGAGLFIREERLGAEVKGRCYALEPGTLIYNRLFAWKQSFAVVGEDFAGAVVSNEFPQFDVDADQATAEYLALYFSTRQFGDLALAHSTGSAAVSRNRLKEADFLSIQVPLPPVPIQKRLVGVISAIDAAIEAVGVEGRRLGEVLKIRRAALVNDPAFDTDRADRAFEIRLGRQRSPQRVSGPSMTPYLRSANVGYDELRLGDVFSMDFDERERQRYALEVGDVLVSEGSAGAAAVGMPAVWRGEIDGPVCFQNTLLRFRAIDAVSLPDFVRHWCLWAFESGTFRDTAPAGVNIKHIGDTRAKAMAVRLPPMDVQQSIVDELNPLADAVAYFQKELSSLVAARDSTLASAIAGAVDIVPESEDDAIE